MTGPRTDLTDLGLREAGEGLAARAVSSRELVEAALARIDATDGRVGACAETARCPRADMDLHVGVAHEERLRVRVHGDELDACKACVDHAVDGVRAAAADADDLDHG